MSRKHQTLPNEQEKTELKLTLLADYVAATERYARAVRELHRESAALPFNSYGDSYKAVEEARHECERLRRVLFELGGE